MILSGNTASSILGFLSFAIMANSLGPEFLAYFALAQVYTQIADNLFNVQTWESLIKFCAKKDNNTQLASTIKTNLLIDIVSAFIAFLFAYLLAQEIGELLDWNETLIELALIYSFVIPFTLTTFTIGIPRLFNKFVIIAKIQFAMALIKFIAIASISYLDGDAKTFTIVYVVTEILINLSLIIYSTLLMRRKKILNWRKTKIYLNREQFKFLWWTNLRTIVRIPVRQLDILIINQVMSLETVGIYKVYKEVVGIIGRLGEPINQAIYPEYAKLLGDDKSNETVSVTKKIMGLLFVLAVITLVGFLIVSEFIIGKFFGPEYLSMMTAFYILVTLNCINLFLTPINSLFIAAGFARYSFYIVLFNNILYLAAALLGGVYFGIYGIIMAFSIQMVFNQGLKIIFLRKHSTGWGNVIR